MNIREFGRAYPPLEPKAPPSNPERRELLEQPRRWTSFFETAMLNYLAGRPLGEDYIDQVVEYVAWGTHYLPAVEKRLRAIDERTGASTYNASHELHFHGLNLPMVYMWGQLLVGEPRLAPDELRNMQIGLSLGAVESIQRLRRTTDEQEARDLTGYVSEIDSAITLLEVPKQQPNLTVFAAPPRFERQRGPGSTRNSDLLLIDTFEREVRGVQAKAFYDPDGVVERAAMNNEVRHREIYDHNFVTVIDGATDLGNTEGRALGGGRVALKTLPGQLALEVLSAAPITLAKRFVDGTMFMRQRRIAQELLHGRKPYLTQAAAHVSERVLHDLYKTPGKRKLRKHSIYTALNK